MLALQAFNCMALLDVLLYHADFEWTSTFSLVLLLVYEAHHCPESFWAPYFRMLPLSFSGKALLLLLSCDE